MVNKAHLVVASLLGAFASVGPGIPAALAQSEGLAPVTEAMLINPDPADRLHISRTYDQHRFSPLKQIHKGLQLAMATLSGAEVGALMPQNTRLPI